MKLIRKSDPCVQYINRCQTKTTSVFSVVKLKYEENKISTTAIMPLGEYERQRILLLSRHSSLNPTDITDIINSEGIITTR